MPSIADGYLIVEPAGYWGEPDEVAEPAKGKAKPEVEAAAPEPPAKTYKCDSCEHTEVRKRNLLVHGDKRYCHDCYAKHVPRCDRCADRMESKDSHKIEAYCGNKAMTVCKSCFENYFVECRHCHKHVYVAYALTVYNPVTQRYDGYAKVCSTCIESRNSPYKGCPQCNNYVEEQYLEMGNDGVNRCPPCHERYGNRGSGCKEPEPQFVMKGAEREYASDKIFDVETKADYIDEDGAKAIRLMLADNRIPYWLPHDYDWNLKTKDGNITTRISKFAHEAGKKMTPPEKVKIPPDILEKIGNLAAKHSAKQTLHHCMMMRNLNGYKTSFWCNSGSCWWGGSIKSRCIYKQHGGFAMLAFDDKDAAWLAENEITPKAKVQPIARAWVFPMLGDKSPASTQDVNAPLLFVFNTYTLKGKYSSLEFARLLAWMRGQAYKKVSLENYDQIFINSGNGYIVGPPELLAGIDKLDLDGHRKTCKCQV